MTLVVRLLEDRDQRVLVEVLAGSTLPVRDRQRPQWAGWPAAAVHTCPTAVPRIAATCYCCCIASFYCASRSSQDEAFTWRAERPSWHCRYRLDRGGCESPELARVDARRRRNNRLRSLERSLYGGADPSRILQRDRRGWSGGRRAVLLFRGRRHDCAQSVHADVSRRAGRARFADRGAAVCGRADDRSTLRPRRGPGLSLQRHAGPDSDPARDGCGARLLSRCRDRGGQPPIRDERARRPRLPGRGRAGALWGHTARLHQRLWHRPGRRYPELALR